MSLRSPLGSVLGQGAAGGVHHWWLQRVGAVALVPLGVWFGVALATLPDLGYASVRAWLAAPLNGVLLLLLIATAAHHSWLGVAVVLEDYVSARATRTLVLLLSQLAHLALAVAAAFAVLKVALGGAP
jgi:succinate dehydrogenase / fumarate reductase membrane anchor subunit